MWRPAYYSLSLPAVFALVLLPLLGQLTPHAPPKEPIRVTAGAPFVIFPTQTPAPPAPVETAPPAIPPPMLAADDPNASFLGGGQTVTLTREEAQFVALTNQERRDRGMPELTVVPMLVQTAREKSREMHDLKYWGHVSPNEKLRTAMARVLAVLPHPPQSMVVGENLYYCDSVLVESGHQALMNSPTHRANILNPEYRYIGVGAFIAPDHRFWVSEHFLEVQP